MRTPTKAAVSRQSASGEVRLTTTWANIIIIILVIIIIEKLCGWTHLLLVLVVELELDIGGTNHPDHRLLSFNVRLLHFLRNKNINGNPNVSIFLNLKIRYVFPPKSLYSSPQTRFRSQSLRLS